MTYDRTKLRNELGRDEGEKLRWYLCTAGKRTIGIGRNLDDVGISAAETRQLGITLASVLSRGITRDQSRALFANDVARCEADLDRRLPWWRRLDDVRQRVLLNMCFNLGIGTSPNPAKRIKGSGLLQFVNTLAMIERGDFAGAARGMVNSLWHKQVGDRALRLETMMATGKDAA